MSILELSPEESLVAANAVALAIFRAYSLENAIFIADFVNAIEGSLTLLLSKQGLIEINEASCKRESINDADIDARLALLEDLLLSLS
ncbi:hypothetical protein psyc5s11_04610 [Clostridium gelidum]|uniref:Uncharacterized protein n=1 Tax=Clostridium gelidum TaxID=704125 RepID=A0ABM7SXQ4_9CLOT|nr:hypothetical protein [Clostridium gelidum]BCZ44394.1 hypothetical protein psyc5s11_04610 [Clostridium gelidum]